MGVRSERRFNLRLRGQLKRYWVRHHYYGGRQARSLDFLKPEDGVEFVSAD